MAMEKRFGINNHDLLSAGGYAVGQIEAVVDFNAAARPDGSRPQQLDKETGMPLWQVTVLDADENASKKEKTFTVKIVAKHQPVLPDNKTPFPFTPVEFTGLTALPYVDDSGLRVVDGRIQGRARIAWSFRATGIVAPGQGDKPEPGKAA